MIERAMRMVRTPIGTRRGWRPALLIGLAMLAAYSAALIWIELQTSQDHVRHFFTDIDGEIPFHGINTSLSTGLLGGAALLLLFAWTCLPDGAGQDARPFLLSQSAMFALFAWDDRFLLHETLGWRLGVDDHFILLGWGLVNLTLLALFCRPRHVSRPMALYFGAALVFCAIMVAFDALVPNRMVLRLSIEDLAKAWGAAMFFGFAWEAARFHLRRHLPREAEREPGHFAIASSRHPG